jgi:hypothetical protein
MPERWERRLQALKEVDAPASVPARVEQGPRGHADPGPSAARRAVTIVVAFVVFAAAGVFAWRAFDRPVTSVVGPTTELPTFGVRFERAGVIDGAPDSPMVRVDTVFDYGDARQTDYTSTTPTGAIVDYVGVASLTAFVPGPTAGSPVSIAAGGTDARILIGSPGDWPSFDRFEAIDRLPQEPGDYILVFQASYPEGIARTARRVRIVEAGTLQLALTEGGKVDGATAEAYVDGRAADGFLSSSTFAQSDTVLQPQPREPDFGSRSPLRVTEGADILLATPADFASAAVVETYREAPADLPIDLADGGDTVDADAGDHLLAVDAVWQHGHVGWASEGTRETARFFFPISVQPGGGSIEPPVTEGPPVVAEFHVGELNDGPATASLSTPNRSVDGKVGSYCWTFDGGGGCGDVFDVSFENSDYLDIVVGSTLTVRGDANSVSGTIDLAGSYPFEPVHELGSLDVPIRLDESPGRYVLEAVAHADQGDVPFYFPIRLVAPASEGGPTSASSVASATVIPDVAGMTELEAYDMLRSLGFIPLASYLPFYDVPAGTVVETQPPAGTEVDPNTTVNMNVEGDTRDNDYSGTSWVDVAIAGDSRYIGSFTDPGGIPVAVVSSRTRAEVHGDIDAIADGRPFFTVVCDGVTRADLDAIVAELRDPAVTPVPATADARMFVDPASCAVAIDQRDVNQSQGSFLASTYGGLVAIEDLRGVDAATRA